jgi:hypothetical protein
MSQNIPSGNDCYIAIEHGQFIVDLPIKDGVDFPQLCFICFPIYGNIEFMFQTTKQITIPIYQ